MNLSFVNKGPLKDSYNDAGEQYLLHAYTNAVPTRLLESRFCFLLQKAIN